MTRVLSIDPGERVGWAHGVIKDMVRPVLPLPQTLAELGDGPPPKAAVIQTEEFKDLEVTGHGITALRPFALKLGEVFTNYDVVVYERFHLAKGKALQLAGSDMQTSQLIGVIRYLSWIHPGVKLVGQYPREMATAEKTAPPWLREILDGLPKAHDDSHDYSALLHLWRYFWLRHV